MGVGGHDDLTEHLDFTHKIFRCLKLKQSASTANSGVKYFHYLLF